MKRKWRGSTIAGFVIFIISGLSASVLGVRQFERHTTHEVIAINSDLNSGTRINQTMLSKVRVDNAVKGIKDPAFMLGKYLSNDKKKGETIQRSDLKKPAQSWLAQQIPQGKVLYTLKPKPGSIPHTQLRNGDYFDVLVSSSRGVRTVARSVLLVGAMSDNANKNNQTKNALSASVNPKKNKQQPLFLVVAVSPGEVYDLARIGAKEAVSLVLHGVKSETIGKRLSMVSKQTHRQVELISGPNRRMVKIALQQSP